MKAIFLYALLALTLLTTSVTAGVRTVAHWRFGDADEQAAANAPSAAETKDSAGTRPLTKTGEASYVADVSGQAKDSKLAVHFNGKDGRYFRNGLFNSPDNFGAEAFVRPATEQGFHVIFQYGSGAHGWSVVRNDKGYQVLLGGIALVGWSGDQPAGQWCHVAVVRDAGKTTFYFNGQPMGSTDAKLNDADGKSEFSVGSAAGGKEQFYEGDIDEVRVFTFPANTFDAADLLLNRSTVPETKPQAETAPARVDNVVARGRKEISVVFDQNPIENGITFRREAMQATQAPDGPDGPLRWGWNVLQGSAQDVPWARSVLLTIKDDDFKNGKQPAIDIDIEYRQTFDSPVECRVDAEKGSRNVGGGWGRNERFQTYHISLNDAFLGARSHGSPVGDMQTDGYDMRINSFGTDFIIRSVKVTGYDLDNDVDYTRLLRLEAIETPNDLLLFHPDEKHVINYKFWNIARKPLDAEYSFEMKTRSGKTLNRAGGKIRIEGSSHFQIPYNLDTAGLPYDVYSLHFILKPSGEASAEPIVDRESYLGVATSTTIAKAAPGEFLYGLDAALGDVHGYTRLLKWMDAMGVDIVRHGIDDNISPDLVAQQLATFESHGLQVLAIHDPPKDIEPGRRQQVLQQKIGLVGTLAARFPQIKFWELGNEPDLTFFYPGPIENYAEDFAKMYDAVKQANPAATVMNGGLSFAGAEATARSRRFVEVVDPARIDAFAYHGHGPGASAEREALERIRAVAHEYGKTGKLYIETESGVAARTESQEQMQARTCVQKMVYAQSQKVPLFIWFRLLMFAEDYGNLRTDQEPRPSVLAYRTMVETLRAHTFSRELDLGKPGLAAHLFQLTGAASNASQPANRACVLWVEQPATHTAYIRLADKAESLHDVRIRDIFGNTSSATVSPDGIVTVTVGRDPVYLIWQTADEAFTPARAPSVIDVQPEISLVQGLANTISVTVRNPLATDVDGNVAMSVKSQTPVTITPASQSVSLKPGASAQVTFSVQPSAVTPAIIWPKTWTTFVSVIEDSIDLAKINQVPETLPGQIGAAEPVRLALRDGKLDFEKAGGEMKEREPGILFAEVISDADRTVTLGASADWWMAWYVNGQPVYNTLAGGNGGGYAITDHMFPVRLKKGSNLIAVKVLSGSMGWKIFIGSPSEVERAKSADIGYEQAQFTLTSGTNVIATETSALSFAAPIAPLAGIASDAPLAEWEKFAPDVNFSDNHVRNFFDKQPDSSKWWKGDQDLGATMWLRADSDHVYIVVKVTDDRHVPAKDEATSDAADGIRLSLQKPGGEVTDVTIGQVGERRTFASGNDVRATIERADADHVTLYRVAVPRTLVGEAPFSINVEIRDSDGGELKQTVSWAAPATGNDRHWQRAAVAK